MKKIIALLLVLVMALTFVACAKQPAENNDSTTASTKGGDDTAATTEGGNDAEVVTLTFATLGTPSACQDQVLAAVNEKLLADGLNIQIQVKQLDDYWNKLALDIAGGAEYDLAWAHSSTLSDLVAKKVYQPITEALNTVGTDLKAKTPEHVLKGGTINGEIYAIPRVIPTTGFSNTYDVRKDLMDKYGMTDITTVEELEAYFQAVLDNEDGMYPYVGSNIQVLFPAYGNYHYLIGDGIYALYVDPADPELTVKSAWESDAYAQMFNKKKEWAEKGYLISAIALRLVLIPTVFVPIAALLGFRGQELCALMILFAAPTAVSSYPMAVAMDADGNFAGQMVAYTTVFCLPTIFLWTLLLNTLGLM